MQMPLVSIIVPVYNVEKYLNQCLNSIINQSLKDIEIIVVNDGSTDNSSTIIEDFANKDSRIKVINKNNSGYGASMNMGLDAANGEYIGIIESDDFAETNMFEILYNKAKELDLDLIKSSFYLYYGDTDKVEPFVHRRFESADKIVKPADSPDMFWIQPSIWSCLYKNELIKKNNIKFLETPGASYQDISFNFKTLALAQKAYLTKERFVYYRQDNINSSVKSKDKVLCVTEEFHEVEKFLEKNPETKNKLEKLKNRLKFSVYVWNYNRLEDLSQTQFLKVMAHEFKEALDNDKIDFEMFSEADWAKYMDFIKIAEGQKL